MINVTIPNLDSILRRLPNEMKARTVLMRSINRSAASGKTIASKKVRQEYVLKAGTVNQATKIAKASTSSLEAKITWKGPMVNLKNFRINPKTRPKRKTKRQMVAEVKKGKKAAYKGAFIGPNGQVFRRTTKKRFPIKPVYGPSIPHLMGADQVREETQKRTLEVLIKRVDHEINRMIGP